MRMKGKKPVFNYKDTWNLDMVLTPIICEGLKKFKEVVTRDDNCAGWPSRINEEYDFGHDINVDDDGEDLALKTWHGILDEMIYAFDIENEPDISKYDFDFVWEDLGKSEQGYSQRGIEITNQEEYNRYKKDEEAWCERKKKGYQLFAKYYDNLWW